MPYRVDDRIFLTSALLLVATASMAQDLTSPPMVQEQDSGLQPMVGNSAVNYELGQSPLGVAAAAARVKAAAPTHFAIPLGSGGFNLDAGIKTEYIDNVFLSHSNAKDDFIVVPQCDLAAFFPVGQLNALSLDVGVAYYEYLKNTALNTGIPLINPNSALEFSLYSGDFGIKFSENFSYQQNPAYETGQQFYNLFNTALFQRYLNRIGALVTWDQNKLVMTAGYFHENLWSETSVYSYIDHASELFSADAMLATSPRLTVGLEAAGSINSFDNSPSYDTWRATVGPAVRINASEFIKVRLGAGYERIQYDSAQASGLGLTPENTYYAYGAIEHRINRFFNHSLTVWHDNQLGFNAANLEGTHVSYALSWAPRKQLTVSPLFSVNFYDESFGSTTANLFHEKFTYYYSGLEVRYQFGPHWVASASWYYALKNSEISTDGYARNQVALGLLYQF